MKPERWQHIERLYHTALECETGRRAAFLAEACSGDDALRREVESLLRYDERAEQFIEAPAFEVAAQLKAEEKAQSLIGSQLGPYQILSILGAGGMGEVYRARDTRLDREVAVKVLPAHLAQNPEALGRFKREAKAVAALSHPNILAIHDFGTDQGVTFAVMELLEGETLRDRLQRAALPWRKTAEIGLAMADGLAAAHAKGIIHRDLKPENIFLTTEERVKILDFGIARVKPPVSAQKTDFAATDFAATTPGTVIGTIGYMSPEQVRGEEAEAPSDIFAFGCVLYEMATGRRAFTGQTMAERMAAILKDDPLPVGGEHGIPARLIQVINRCLMKPPEQRFQTARELVEELRATVTSGAAVATQQSLIGRTGRWRTGPMPPSLILVTLVLLAAVTGTVWWWKSRAATPRLLQQRLLSTFPGAHREASFSPDGSMIAFINVTGETGEIGKTGETGGVPQVWIKNLAQGDPLQITSGEQPAHRPRWSPRNDQIVFSRSVSRIHSIWSVPPLGGTARKIIDRGRNPSFSGDGSRLVYEKQDEVWTANADGGEQRKVEGVPQVGFLLADRTPALSPDGSLIAFFQCSQGPFGDIWVIPTAGGQPRQLTFDDNLGGTITWTPDGRHIVFASLRSGSRTLWRVAAGGGVPEPLLQGAGEDTEPEFSRDGAKLVYTNTRNSFILTLWNPITNQSRVLKESRYDLFQPLLSPQGDKIAFFALIDEGELQIHTINPDGGGLTQVTRGKGERNVMPRWAPDGSALFFYHLRPAKSFRKIPVSGGPSREIAAGWTWATHNAAQIDPTGERIAYTKLGGAQPATTIIREIETGKETAITPTLQSIRWSRDGQSLLGVDLTAYTPNSVIGDISICALASGKCRKLARGSHPVWSRDESRVYFLRYTRAREGQELWSLSADGRDEKLVGLLHFHPIDDFFDVSPQGEIVYVRFSPGKPEMWLAEFSNP